MSDIWADKHNGYYFVTFDNNMEMIVKIENGNIFMPRLLLDEVRNNIIGHKPIKFELINNGL